MSLLSPALLFTYFWFVQKATHPGLLKVSGLQEGVYTFKMTVTDMAGQKSSDDVSVTVLAPKHQAEGSQLLFWNPFMISCFPMKRKIDQW